MTYAARSFTFLTLGLSSFVGFACGGEGSADPSTTEAAALGAAEASAAWAEAAAATSPVFDVDGGTGFLEAATAAYASGSPCATRSVSGGTLTVDFGSGCTYRGYTVTGAVDVAASAGSGAIRADLAFRSLSAGVRTLDGTLTLGARLGSGVAIDAQLSVAESTVTTDLTLSGTAVASQTEVTVDGSASRSDGVESQSLSMSSVSVAYGDCYPSAGSVVVQTSSSPRTTVTFSAATPTTGAVTVQVGLTRPRPSPSPPVATEIAA